MSRSHKQFVRFLLQDYLIICEFDQLLDESAGEETFIDNFVDHILSEVLHILRVFVCLQHFLDQGPSVYVFLKQVQVEVQVWQQNLLSRQVFVAALVEEVDASLEQI